MVLFDQDFKDVAFLKLESSYAGRSRSSFESMLRMQEAEDTLLRVDFWWFCVLAMRNSAAIMFFGPE